MELKLTNLDHLYYVLKDTTQEEDEELLDSSIDTKLKRSCRVPFSSVRLNAPLNYTSALYEINGMFYSGIIIFNARNPEIFASISGKLTKELKDLWHPTHPEFGFGYILDDQSKPILSTVRVNDEFHLGIVIGAGGAIPRRFPEEDSEEASIAKFIREARLLEKYANLLFKCIAPNARMAKGIDTLYFTL